MIWRFAPMADPAVDVFLSRDLDSELTAREREAVLEWMGTGKPIHAMRDNPFHNTPILGKYPNFTHCKNWL
jgi:hypothetical protein